MSNVKNEKKSIFFIKYVLNMLSVHMKIKKLYALFP